MIARIWHGWTTRRDAPRYEKMLREDILPGIAESNIGGYNGAELFIRETGDEVEFMTMLRFASLEAVKSFAGENYETPVIHPEAKGLLTRFDERSQHYKVVV